MTAGYTGGHKPNPTYRGMKDHTEAVRIDFDPSKLSLRALLDLFWKQHHPFGGRSSCQYRTAVWYTNDKQKEVVLKSKDALLLAHNQKEKKLATGS